MPYTEKELLANEHYVSLKARDEGKYNSEFDEVKKAFNDRGGMYWDTLRDSSNIIQLYEKISDGKTRSHNNQRLHVELYRRRYRTKIESKDIFDIEFKEF